MGISRAHESVPRAKQRLPHACGGRIRSRRPIPFKRPTNSPAWCLLLAHQTLRALRSGPTFAAIVLDRSVNLGASVPRPSYHSADSLPPAGKASGPNRVHDTPVIESSASILLQLQTSGATELLGLDHRPLHHRGAIGRLLCNRTSHRCGKRSKATCRSGGTSLGYRFGKQVLRRVALSDRTHSETTSHSPASFISPAEGEALAAGVAASESKAHDAGCQASVRFNRCGPRSVGGAGLGRRWRRVFGSRGGRWNRSRRWAGSVRIGVGWIAGHVG